MSFLYKHKRKIKFILPIFLVLVVFVFIGHYSLAAGEQQKVTENSTSIIAGTLSLIVYGFAAGLGKILTLILSVIGWLFIQQSFWKDPSVNVGWVAVRDVANMGFILVLLFISFATILRLPNYQIKSILPKLLIMAVLINFSKTITLLFIDISQVVMLTFASAFAGNGAASNFVNALHIKDIFQFGIEKEYLVIPVTSWNIFFSLLLALVVVILSIIIMIMMAAMLLIRIVMLMVLIVLSPLAFISYALPGGKYFSQWTSELSKYLISGPVLAFFVWLSLSILSGIDESSLTTELQNKGGDSFTMSLTSIGQSQLFNKYLLAVALLVGAMKVTASLGAAGSGIGMNMANKLKSKGVGYLNKAKDFGVKKTGDLAKSTFSGVGRLGLAGLGTVDRGLGRGFDKLTGSRTNMGDKGLVNRSTQAVVNLPKNLSGSISKGLNKNDSINRSLRDYYEAKKKDPDALLSHDKKKYKLQDGKFIEWDMVEKKAKENGEILKKKYIGLKGEYDAKEMSDPRVSMYDAWNSASSKSRAIANKAQQEAISKEKQNFINSNMSAGDMRRLMNDKTTSSDKKKALALALAEKGDLGNYATVERGAEVLGSNDLLVKEFRDNVDKNEAHIGYDFAGIGVNGKPSDPGDLTRIEKAINKFIERIDQGKIDSAKLNSDAYMNPTIIDALNKYHGKDFSRVIETAFKRGKKYEESVSKGLFDNIGRDISGIFNPITKEIDKFANSYAKLTGNLEKAFSTSGSLNEGALMQFIESGKAADINKLQAKDLAEDLTNKFTETFVRGITAAKLKQMHRNGDNPALVKKVKKIITDNNLPAKDNFDDELKSI